MEASASLVLPVADTRLGAHELHRLLERLHRRFLDVVRIELQRLGYAQITPVQALMLLTIADTAQSLGELVQRGYYLGAAAAGNLKMLVEAGFVEVCNGADRRTASIHLTDVGTGLCQDLRRIEADHMRLLTGYAGGEADLQAAYRVLRRLEQSWSDVIHTESIDMI